MISIGKSFFANRFLRIEVFGDNSKIKLIIGNNVSLGQNVHIGVTNDVRIMDNVLIGSNVLITDHNHGNYSGSEQSSPYEAPVLRKLTTDGYIIINRNVWIGDGVVILPNVEIGSGTIIGANSVVAKSIPENVIAGGIPCKIIKKYNDASAIWESVKN
jgi:lipopolysaccharide O-acetyltransferase